MTRAEQLQELTETYERHARHNRPDWDAFIEDATTDPYGIACEWIDLARELWGASTNNNSDLIDAIYNAAYKWVDAL